MRRKGLRRKRGPPPRSLNKKLTKDRQKKLKGRKRKRLMPLLLLLLLRPKTSKLGLYRVTARRAR